MTTITQAEHPKGRVRHSWRCDRQSPVLETTARAMDGSIWVVWRCQQCGGSDLDSRLLDQRIKPDPPDPDAA